MEGDGPYRELVAALWVLLRCGTPQVPAGELHRAAADAVAAMHRVGENEQHVVLQERDGALFANGACLRPDVDSFSSITGIVELMRQHDVGEVLLLASADADQFVRWARAFAAAGPGDDLAAVLQTAGCSGIHAAQRDPALVAADTALGAREQPALPSHLSVVFTMQRFSAAVDAEGPLGGGRARAILQDAIEQLLQQPSGLLPLLALDDDEELALAVRTTVLTVRIAEALGWPAERAQAAGVQALPGAPPTPDAEALQLARVARHAVEILGS